LWPKFDKNPRNFLISRARFWNFAALAVCLNPTPKKHGRIMIYIGYFKCGVLCFSGPSKAPGKGFRKKRTAQKAKKSA
jgi:hypothetical protein